ncbi:hypothetical protein OKW45_002626 [Paraburkholderia sp. WSM4175]
MNRDRLATARREAVRRIAYRLADSGNYADCQAVEKTLRARYDVLDSRQLLRVHGFR